MNKFVIAATAVVALSGAALAQEAPALIYSDAFAQNVQNVGDASFSGSASITQEIGGVVPGSTIFSINQNENYSGR